MSILETRTHDHVTEISCEQDDARIVGREPAQGLNERLPQLRVSNSASAIWYS